MASFAGTVDARIVSDKVRHNFIGRTQSLGILFTQDFGSLIVTDGVGAGQGPAAVPLFDGIAGPITADQEGTPGVRAIVSHDGVTNDQLVFGEIWRGLVHLLPRGEFEFGNIVTFIEDTFEIYNALRAEVTLTSITNNVAPGVIFPSISPPEVMPAQTSLLDPSTSDNSGGTGLGTLVPLKIQALTDGLPQFNDSVIFVTTANDPLLIASGTRIVLIPYDYEDSVRETLSFKTQVIAGLDGHEQRIALRKQPRQEFSVEYSAEGLDRQRLQALLFDWMDNIFAFPLWHERVLLTAPTIVGATQYPISGGDDVDFRVGGLAVVLTDNIVFDVLEITAVTDTLITASSPSLNAYPIRTRLAPVRTVVIPHRIQSRRSLNNLERLRVTFQSLDNDTGAPTGDVAPGFWSTFNGRVLFDDCNQIDTAMSGSLQRRIHRLDNTTGLFEQSSIWDRNKRGSEKGFLARSRGEILAIRKLFTGLRGRQVAFYIPTAIEEITVQADLTLGIDTMDIVSVGYVRFVKDRLPMTIFRITFTDGTSLVRTILSSVVISLTVERFTLDDTWPANRTIAEIDRVEWYELVRFDADKMVLRYKRIGLANTKMPLMRVFDDN